MDNVTDHQGRRLAELLRAVADARTTADRALSLVGQWDDVSWDVRTFDDAYHALQHFKIDEDIRLKDQLYGDQQRQGLDNIAKRLDRFDSQCLGDSVAP